jgi:hypothetical protein
MQANLITTGLAQAIEPAIMQSTACPVNSIQPANNAKPAHQPTSVIAVAITSFFANTYGKIWQVTYSGSFPDRQQHGSSSMPFHSCRNRLSGMLQYL